MHGNGHPPLWASSISPYPWLSSDPVSTAKMGYRNKNPPHILSEKADNSRAFRNGVSVQQWHWRLVDANELHHFLQIALKILTARVLPLQLDKLFHPHTIALLKNYAPANSREQYPHKFSSFPLVLKSRVSWMRVSGWISLKTHLTSPSSPFSSFQRCKPFQGTSRDHFNTHHRYAALVLRAPR